MIYSLKIWHFELYFLIYLINTLHKEAGNESSFLNLLLCSHLCPTFKVRNSPFPPQIKAKYQPKPKCVAHTFWRERNKYEKVKLLSDEWAVNIFFKIIRSEIHSWESELWFISNRNNCLILSIRLFCPSQIMSTDQWNVYLRRISHKHSKCYLRLAGNQRCFLEHLSQNIHQKRSLLCQFSKTRISQDLLDCRDQEPSTACSFWFMAVATLLP